MDQEPTEQDTDIAKTSKITPKTTKIPPLVVNTTTLKQEHKNELVNNIRNLKLNIKIKYSSDNITIFTPTKETQQQVKELLIYENKQFHRYAETETKDIKLVIKGLPPLNPKEIEENLISMGIQPKKVSQLKLPKQESYPIYYLAMEPSANIAKIKAIKYLCCVKIRLETYKNPRKITQCYRCQEMGHGSSNCYAKPKCVKCAGDHITKDCTKSPQDTPKCASSAGPLTTNATICTFYKLQLQKIETNRARNSEKFQTKNSSSPAGHSTNRTLQHQRRTEQFPALPARPTQSPAPTAPTASSRQIPDRRQQQQQEEQPSTTRNEGNKRNPNNFYFRTGKKILAS